VNAYCSSIIIDCTPHRWTTGTTCSYLDACRNLHSECSNRNQFQQMDILYPHHHPTSYHRLPLSRYFKLFLPVRAFLILLAWLVNNNNNKQTMTRYTFHFTMLQFTLQASPIHNYLCLSSVVTITTGLVAKWCGRQNGSVKPFASLLYFVSWYGALHDGWAEDTCPLLVHVTKIRNQKVKKRDAFLYSATS
jgi:hypothetical protein